MLLWVNVQMADFMGAREMVATLCDYFTQLLISLGPSTGGTMSECEGSDVAPCSDAYLSSVRSLEAQKSAVATQLKWHALVNNFPPPMHCSRKSNGP